MNPYLLTSIIFTLILGVVWIVVKLKNGTIYLPNMTEGATEDIALRKEKAEKMRSRNFVFGIGGTVVLCILVYVMIMVSGPVKKVYAVFNPSATPTITNTPTATATRTPTRTPRFTFTPRPVMTFEAISTLTAQATRGTSTSIIPSGSGGSGGGSVTIIQTRVVIQTRIVAITRIVYVVQTVLVTETPVPIYSETPSLTPTATLTHTPTSTPTLTETPTFISTETETPTP